jgi:DNA-binding CsgD family transcriptional regulator
MIEGTLSTATAHDSRRHLHVVDPGTLPAVPDWVRRLSPREAEVLRCLADGMSSAEIAQALWISNATVKSHVARLIAKVGVRDRLQLVVEAYRSGFVRVP